MALSSTIIPDLKKKSLQAKKKELSFFFFEKGEDKKPTLLLGLKSETKKEKDALVKKVKRAPTARGILRKNDATRHVAPFWRTVCFRGCLREAGGVGGETPFSDKEHQSSGITVHRDDWCQE